MGTGINLQQILKAIEAKSPEVWGPQKSMTMANLQRMRFASVESKGEEHLLAIIYILIYIHIYTWRESAINFNAFMSLVFIWYCAVVGICK